MNIEKLIKWQQEKPEARSVEIKIEKDATIPTVHHKNVKIWLYDTAIMQGIHLKSVDDIDTLDMYQLKKEKQLARLKQLEKELGINE